MASVNDVFRQASIIVAEFAPVPGEPYPFQIKCVFTLERSQLGPLPVEFYSFNSGMLYLGSYIRDIVKKYRFLEQQLDDYSTFLKRDVLTAREKPGFKRNLTILFDLYLYQLTNIYNCSTDLISNRMPPELNAMSKEIKNKVANCFESHLRTQIKSNLSVRLTIAPNINYKDELSSLITRAEQSMRTLFNHTQEEAVCHNFKESQYLNLLETHCILSTSIKKRLKEKRATAQAAIAQSKISTATPSPVSAALSLSPATPPPSFAMFSSFSTTPSPSSKIRQENISPSSSQETCKVT